MAAFFVTDVRNPSELEARSAAIQEKEGKLFSYKRKLQGEKSCKSGAGLITCLSSGV